MANPYRPPPADWARIDTIFTQALDLDPERWPAFLEEACGEDVEVRTRVTDLLRRSQTVDDFLEESCLEVQPELAGELAHRLESRDAPFPTEARIGAYRIIDTLGRGGAGTVYLAERAEGGERPPVALKVLRRGLDTDDLLERFTVERQILATLHHPDVARLLDAGATDDGRPYLVMEHVDGVPITEHCGARGLSVQERLGLFARVARAVHHAHGSLIVHRDLKPTNVLVAEDGAPKLLDFGIAKLLDPDALAGKGPQTRTGTRLLTPGYASPEQRRGEPVTPASDIYQLGLLLYELLTGVAAYEAAGKERGEKEEGNEGGEEKRRAYRDQWGDGDRPLPRIPAPSKVVRRTGGTGQGKEAGEDTDPAREAPPDTGSTTQRRRRRDLDRIVMTALEEEPADRYPTAAALAADVERVLKGQRPHGVAHLPMGILARKLARRLGTRRRKAAAAALAIGAVAGILAVASVSSRDPGNGEPPAPDPGDPMFHLVPPPWVVVAEFDAPADQPELGWTVRELVMEGLDQSGGAAPLPSAELRVALRMAGLSDTTRIHAALARELAYRNGLAVALTGSVFRLGNGYGIRANALDPVDGSALASVREQSPDQDGVMAALERTATRLAVEAGGALGTRREVRPATLLTTSSFEAYEEYLRYLRAHREGRPTAEREGALHSALDLDPELAMAWRALAIGYHERSQPDSARLAIARALALRDQVTDLERLHIEAAEARLGGDDEAEIGLYGRILSVNPRDESAHNHRFLALSRQRRYEEALSHLDALQALFPEDQSSRSATRRFQSLLSLGRFEEAQDLQSRLPKETWQEGEILMALGVGEWAVAESLALAIQHDPGASRSWKRRSQWAEAAAQAARGAVRAADSTLRAFPSWDHGRARLVLALATGCDLAAGRVLTTAEDTTAFRLRWNAVLATAMGEHSLADEFRYSANRRRNTGDQSGHPHLALTLWNAFVFARRGSWPEITRVATVPLLDKALEGVHAERLGYGTTALRWLVADAYERSGQPDSAAVYFHMVTDSASSYPGENLVRGFAYPFAHRRLAFLYAGLGDRRRALHHWEVFRATFTDPDPELLWLVEESRLERSLPVEQGEKGDLANGGLFSDADRACASIEAGRLSSLHGALASTAAAYEGYYAEHGRYEVGKRSIGSEARREAGFLDHHNPGGEVLMLTEGDEAGWTATAIDLRDSRTCSLSGGEGPMVMEGHPVGEVLCAQRTLSEAYREDQGTLAIRGALFQFERICGQHLTPTEDSPRIGSIQRTVSVDR
jgi:serine/threonine protein kinase/tetratricopeptide (TPR) repeat protein